jgi:hypothetical protein
VFPSKVSKIRGLQTAVAGDVPPLMGFLRLSKSQRIHPSRVLVRDPLLTVLFGLEVFGGMHRPEPGFRLLPQA